MWVFAQQTFSGNDLTGSAVAALKTVFLDEGLLYGAELLAVHETFDSRDFVSLGFHGEGEAGVARLASHEHRTGAAFASVATDLGAGHVQFVPEDIEECDTGLDRYDTAVAIDDQLNIGAKVIFVDLSRRITLKRTGGRNPNRTGAQGFNEPTAA